MSRIAQLEALGFAMTSTYVPVSKADLERGLLTSRLKWNVVVTYKGREVYTGKYEMGVAYITPKVPMRLSLEDAEHLTACLLGQQTIPRGWGRPKFSLIPPELDYVMWSLIQDASVIDYPDFESWAPELGFDSDSRKAEKIYNECLAIALRMNSVIPRDIRDMVVDILADM